MPVKFSLAHLTVLNASPPELVSLAARCGYDGVGIRLTEVTGGDAFPLITDRALMRETRARMAGSGVAVLDVELARLLPQTVVPHFRPMMEAAAELGARHVLSQGHDPDLHRQADNYAALCDLAEEYGLTADVEFLTWTKMRGLSEAAEMVMGVHRPNAGIAIDTLHFFRSGCSPEAISALPVGLFHYLQIADAPSQAPDTNEGLIHTAREDRLNPGEGGLDLAGVLRRLPADLPISIEIPNSALAKTMSDDARVTGALTATRRLVQSIARSAESAATMASDLMPRSSDRPVGSRPHVGGHEPKYH